MTDSPKEIRDLNEIAVGLSRFHKNFPIDGNVYLEDSVLWYCIDMGVDWYLSLSIHQRISFKQSYFDLAYR